MIPNLARYELTTHSVFTASLQLYLLIVIENLLEREKNTANISVFILFGQTLSLTISHCATFVLEFCSVK